MNATMTYVTKDVRIVSFESVVVFEKSSYAKSMKVTALKHMRVNTQYWMSYHTYPQEEQACLVLRRLIELPPGDVMRMQEPFAVLKFDPDRVNVERMLRVFMRDCFPRIEVLSGGIVK